MKARVRRPFTDKHTLQRVSAGSEIEVTEERFEEINSTALGIFVEEIKPEDPAPTESTKEEKAKKKTVKSR